MHIVDAQHEHDISNRSTNVEENIKMDEAVKALQEISPNTSIDTSLSAMENFKFLIVSLKEYASRIKGKAKTKVEVRPT